jgi:uncharacterized protein (UPF0335 family)
MTKATVVQLEHLKTRVDHLLQLHDEAKTAAEAYTDALKTVAENSGLDASTVRRYIAARAGDKFYKVKSGVMQMALVFEETGE